MNAPVQKPVTALPGRPTPYVLRAGDGLCHLVAGQVIRTLASGEETAGAFGAVICDAPLDRGPIPMHFHEREHDTWFCTRGKLQVWCGEQSRVLAPGDFAYVKPGDIHSYQSVAPHSQFFGIVAPGGWERFFVEVGDPWASAAFPPADFPFDFRRMGPAMAKFDVNPVPDAVYAPATSMGEGDRDLPPGHASYVLEAGFGRRRLLFDHLSTAVLTADQEPGGLDMRVIEGGRCAVLPPHRSAGHSFLYMLDGSIALTLDGAEHRLFAGDGANIPAGATVSSVVLSGAARWLLCTGGGGAPSVWDVAGVPTDAHCFPHQRTSQDDLERARAAAGDATFI